MSDQLDAAISAQVGRVRAMLGRKAIDYSSRQPLLVQPPVDAGRADLRVIEWSKGGDSASALLADLGFRTAPLRPVDRNEADAVAVRALSTEPFYDQEVMPKADASRIATEFGSLFGEQACFWVNVDEAFAKGNSEYNFDPLTDATLNVSIVAIGNGLGGVLWVDDED